MEDSPYLQIAREHLTTEELEMLLAERKHLAPQKMTKEQEKENYYFNYFDKHL